MTIEKTDLDLLGSILDGNTIDDQADAGGDQNLEGDDATTDKPDDTTTDQPDGDDAGKGDTGTDADDADEPGKDQPPATDEKTNAAFARMRTENAQMAKTLKQLAQALNINAKDHNEIIAQLQGAAVKKLAEVKQLPPEVYAELESSREQLQHLQLQQNIQTARSKFLTTQENYGLKPEELMAFIKQLDEDGINVIENPTMDVDLLYIKYNHKKILEKEKAKAVEEALKNDKRAGDKSTTPSKQTSRPSDNDDKINSIDGLNALLDGK